MLAPIANKPTPIGLDSKISEITGISFRPIYRHFGGWQQFVDAAGLGIHPSHKLKIPDSELFDDYLQQYKSTGSHVRLSEFRLTSKYSKNIYATRFGGFNNFRKLALRYGIEQGIIPLSIKDEECLELTADSGAAEAVYPTLGDRPILGEQLNFRGLVHAPVNEMGVVYLFGILSKELGFQIESVQSGFPDCEGKRQLKKDRWQRVRIEFEYVSSNFHRHRHDIAKCDLIVCWIHDWKDCPLEVLSLKDFIQSTRQ